MATWAAGVEEAPVPRAATPRAARRERRVAGGAVWIGVVSILLAGVVATNVAVLRLNMELDRLGRERSDLRAQSAALSSRLSSAASAPLIQRMAAERLGWVEATPAETTYFDLRP